MAIGDDEDNDPLSVVRRMQQGQSAGQATTRRRTQSSFPAANQVANPRNTAFARNAPINTIAQNTIPWSQIPVGGIGTSFGYRSQPMNLDNFTPSGGPQQQPTLQGYHWYAGTGGVQGGNNANADLTWSDGTRTNVNSPLGGLPVLGSTQPIPQPQYPQAPDQYPVTAGGGINYNVPGGSLADALNKTAPAGMDYNAGTGQYLPASTPGYMSATKGPSQFASAPVTTNQFGQNMINPAGGGQMTTDKRQKPWLGGY